MVHACISLSITLHPTNTHSTNTQHNKHIIIKSKRSFDVMITCLIRCVFAKACIIFFIIIHFHDNSDVLFNIIYDNISMNIDLNRRKYNTTWTLCVIRSQSEKCFKSEKSALLHRAWQVTNHNQKQWWPGSLRHYKVPFGNMWQIQKIDKCIDHHNTQTRL